ncbi:stress responsive a/B barrel domain-containing protein [Trichoderma breve]|uniref:Stress responsive a/B barrel domain-containing protein n=1 Tax=Trichoderma breve TaxID=2034170 RepID=A0A9W9E2Q9_9HYPO|nr:stress responsive a/B barrel domain-containing protein [Trichoderma breve]KAJ4856728.1 stress responsive a/B barrel domain-containing protein [Trichoderma breve]
MPVYHVVLFKLKPDVTAEQVDDLREMVLGMHGQIPGLLKISFGEPLPITASRAQGFNIGIVAILDKADTIPIYAAHAAHQPVMKKREELCTDALAYDMEFDV